MDTSPEMSHEPPVETPSVDNEANVEAAEAVEATAEAMESMSPEQEAEQDRLEQLEGLDARQEDSEVRDALEGDAAETLKAMKLDDAQHEQLGEMLKGLSVAAHEVTEEHEGEYRDMIDNLLTERYKMTLEEFLGAFKPTKMEYISPGTALGSEAAIWAAAKAFNVEPKNLSLKEKAEYRWKVGGDVFKILGLIAKVIPQARAFSMPLAKLGMATEKMGQAMEKVNENPEATSWDASRELTLAMVPRSEDGSVDMKATLAMIQEAGGLLEQGGQEAGVSNELLTQVSTWMKENPDQLVGGVQRMDQLVR
ncbi:MAG: hypothetical protein P8J32_05635, partial [bacterium]|nr:hypothetical protein [bacterium]